MRARNRILVLLGASLIGSLASAVAFVAVLNWTLPPTDTAHGQSILETLSDPFVRAVMLVATGISAVVAFPVLYFGLRGRNLRVALPIIFGSVLLEIAVVTPFAGPLGWLGSYLALLGALVFCRLSPMNALKT